MNRCPKCDNDRFVLDKKGNLHTEKISIEIVDPATGEITSQEADAVKCSWCGYLMPIKDAPVAPALPH